MSHILPEVHWSKCVGWPHCWGLRCRLWLRQSDLHKAGFDYQRGNEVHLWNYMSFFPFHLKRRKVCHWKMQYVGSYLTLVVFFTKMENPRKTPERMDVLHAWNCTVRKVYLSEALSNAILISSELSASAVTKGRFQSRCVIFKLWCGELNFA